MTWGPVLASRDLFSATMNAYFKIKLLEIPIVFIIHLLLGYLD